MADLALEGIRGDTNVFDLTIEKTTLGVTGPVNLAGASIWFTAKRHIADTDADAEIQKGNAAAGLTGIAVTNPTAGLAVLTILPADSSGLEDGDVRLVCDIQVKEADGTTSTTKGYIVFSSDVTKAA